MKFSTLAALLGAVTASSMQAEVKRDQVLLKDEMEALLELVQQVETKEQSQIFDTIEVRKEVLKSLAAEMPERKRAIANEVTNLSNLVGRVLEEDYDGAVDELEARKEELMDVHNYLTSLQPIVVQPPPACDADCQAAKVEAVRQKAIDDGLAAAEVERLAEAERVKDAEAETARLAEVAETARLAEVERLRLEKVATDAAAGNEGDCDLACKAKKVTDAALKKTADALAAAKKKAKANPGVAIGLGVVGGVLAVGAVVYCMFFKKKPEEESGEGGKRQTKESLLVHFEEA